MPISREGKSEEGKKSNKKEKRDKILQEISTTPNRV